MRILVTGAAGFLGSHVARHLHALGHSVLGVDSYDAATSMALKQQRVASLLSPLGIQVLSQDLSDYAATQTLLSDFRPEVIVHLAARPGVRTTEAATPYYIHSNLVAFTNVWSLAHATGVELLLYASSSSVYGSSGRPGVQLSEVETHPVPINLYGATKLANEVIAGTRLASSSLRTLGLRLFTLYGPWGRPDMLPLRAMQALISGRSLPLYGDGSAVRDFTYIDDAVSVIGQLLDWSLSSNGPWSEVVNVADGSTATVKEYLSLMQRISGRRFSLQQHPALSVEMSGTKASTSKLQSLIGHAKWTPLEEGLARTWEWFSHTDLPDDWDVLGP